MDILKAITGRRSIRVYEKKPVSDNSIRQILDRAIWAPSACNRQGWRFILIKDRNLKEQLVKNGTAYFVKEVPTLILVLYDNRTDNEEYKDYIQSASALIQNIHLMAYSEGLGSCWINNLPLKKTLRKIFRIPGFYDPIALVALGYPKKSKVPKPPKRIKKLNELISVDRFLFKEKKSLKEGIKLNSRKTARRVYLRLPRFIKFLFEPFARKFERRFD